MKLHTASRSRPCSGFSSSGDLAVVRSEDGTALLAVVDVLGHGPEAAAVAQIAGEYLAKLELDADVSTWMAGLHDALSRTRGAAAGLARACDGELELAVVGNVAVRSRGTRVGIVASPGIIGRRVRRIRAFSFSMQPGDRVALYSDGLRRVELGTSRGLPADRACDHLMNTCASTTDDATILVADFDHA